MPDMMTARTTARIEGDFVVFLIGMRINKPWKVLQWAPAIMAMPAMIRELEAAPAEVGFLGHNGLRLGGIVQYWRSFAHLETYARARDRKHWPAWIAFNRRMKNARGDVGIWHETYRVRAGEYETLYSGMPLYGLAKASSRALVTAESESARSRLEPGA